MAIDGFPDICSDGTEVVGQWSTTPGPGLMWFNLVSRTTAERPLFVRAVSLAGVQVAIYKGADSNFAYLINSAGVEVALGATSGNQCVGIRVVSSEIEAVWVESQTVWKSRRFTTGVVATAAVVTNAVPAAEVGRAGTTGFLDLDANGIPLWTDTNRSVTVKGVPLLVPVRRGGYYIGQLGGGFLDQIVAVHGTTGAVGTLYEGLGLEPHAALADGGSGAVLVAFRRLNGQGAFFTAFPPLPTFTGVLSQQLVNASGAAGAAGVNTNPVPLIHPVIDPARHGLMTSQWAAWARGVNRLQMAPPNFAAGGTGILPPANLGSGTPGLNTVLRGDGTWGPLPGTEVLPFALEGYGSAIGTGVRGHLYVPYPCFVVGVVLMADQAGDLVLDLWKGTVGTYPPVVGGSIVAAAKPTLSSAAVVSDTTLAGWSRTLAFGDILAYQVDAAATVTRVDVALLVSRL